MEGLLVAFAVFVLALWALGNILDFLSSNSQAIITGLVVLGFGIGAILLLIKAREAGSRMAESRESERQSKLAAERQLRAEKLRDAASQKLRQVQLYNDVIDCRQRVISFLGNAPLLVSRSEELLQTAIEDLGERAFYPFWDHVEQSTMLANEFQEKLKLLKGEMEIYAKLKKEYKGNVPNFPATGEVAKHLRISLETVNRIKMVERRAHRDFEFAQIFGTRKTNSILIAGFQNLSDALSNIGASIDRVTVELQHGFATVAQAQLVSANAIVSAIDYSTTAILESNSDLRDAFAGQAGNMTGPVNDLVRLNSESAEREKFAIKALDNIQRNRRPLPFSEH